MSLPDFSGEFGGLLAAMYMSGWLSCYAWAKNTIVKDAKKEITELKDSFKGLKNSHRNQIDELKEEYKTQAEDLEIKYEKKLKNVRNDMNLQAKMYADKLMEQEKICEERMEAQKDIFEERLGWFERRLVQVEDSRVNIALGGGDDDNTSN